MKALLAFAILAATRPAFADRPLAPHIIDKIRQDRERDQPGAPAQIPLYDELPPPDWRPPTPGGGDLVPELDRSEIDRTPEKLKPGNSRVFEFSMTGGDDEAPQPASKSAGQTNKKREPSPWEIEAAHKAISTGDSRDLDKIFGENRFAAVEALAFASKGMDQSALHLDNATALAEARMVGVPAKIDPANPSVRLFQPALQHALLTRPDMMPATGRAGIQSLVDIKAKAINDPPELARKLLADAFGRMSTAAIERTLAGWNWISSETAQLVTDALARTRRPQAEVARLQSLVEVAK